MLSTIPVNEMAQTLRVLAGDNATSAARHFTKRSYDLGDVASAVLWSSIVQVLNSRHDIAETSSLDDMREGLAYYGVRYDDVDAETLACEETARDAAPIGRREQALIIPLNPGYELACAA